MSTNKNNLNSSVLGARVKKYDTYTRRSTDMRHKPVHVPSAIVVQPSVSIDYKSHQKNTVQDISTDRNQYFHKKNPNLSLPTQQKLRTQKIPKSYNKPAPQQPQTNRIAMRSVAAAKIYENEMYPDNEVTVYAVAKRRLSLLQKFMYGFGVFVLVFSAAVSVQSFMTNNEAKEQIATLGENTTEDEQGVSEGTGDEPSEEAVSDAALRAYVPPDPRDPRYIRIPELGVISRIKNMGVTGAGAVDAPKNIYDTGWYNGSVRPGSSTGSSLILGHVSGWTGPGVFKNISRLVPGSQFEVEKGNGEVVRYSVTRTQQIPLDQVNMSEILGTEVAGQHDIKLMTCSGRYNKETRSYEDRFVVYATQIK